MEAFYSSTLLFPVIFFLCAKSCDLKFYGFLAFFLFLEIECWGSGVEGGERLSSG